MTKGRRHLSRQATGQVSAQAEQATGGHQQQQQGIQVTRTRDLALLTGLAQAFGGRLFCSFHAVLVFGGHGSASPQHGLNQQEGLLHQVRYMGREAMYRQHDDDEASQHHDWKTHTEDIQLRGGPTHHTEGEIDQQ